MKVKGIELRTEPNERAVNSRSGICLVLGSSPSVFKDVKDAVELLRHDDGSTMNFDVMACNLSFLAWTGRLDHLVSLHQDKLPHFSALAYGLPIDRPAYIQCHKAMDSADKESLLWDFSDQNGTSSLFCVKIAHLLGYSKIILCGVSLQGNHRFYDNPCLEHKNNMGCEAIELSWHEYKWLPYKAISGKPMMINGFPTKEWLEA